MNTRITACLKWIGISCVAIAIIYAVLLILANRSLAKAFTALEADGRPMKAEQIIPAEVPDSDNAALLYDAAVLILKGKKSEEGNLFSELSELSVKTLDPNPEKEAINKYRKLIQNKQTVEALSLIEQGTLKPSCRYNLDFFKGPALALPHLSDLRNVSRIICAKARLQALDGQYDAAWQTVITNLRLADGLRNEPLLISQLVRFSLFGMTADTIQSLCLGSTPSDIQYSKITELISDVEDITPFLNAVDCERLLFGDWVFNVPIVELKKMLEMSEDNDKGFTLIAAFPPLFHRDYAAYLTVMHTHAKSTTPVYTEKDNQLEEEIFNKVPKYCILTRLLVPAMSSVKRSYNANIARARITRTGLAALQYKQTNGSFPEKLSDLSLQNIADPFLGGPLQYKSNPSGFIVYSIGENLEDDGGVRSKNKHSGDIVWKFEEPVNNQPE